MKGYLALSKTEIKLFLREPFSIIFVLVFPIMMMLLLSSVFGNDPENAQDMENGMLVWRGVTPTDYYTAASVPMVIAAFGILTFPVQLAGYRERGVLRRLRASSVPAITILCAHLTVGLLTVAVGATLMGTISWLAYGAQLPDDPTGVVVGALLGTVTFSALGALLATFISSSRAAQGIGLLLFFTMWLIAGTAPPRAVLPSGLRDFSGFLPLTHLVEAVQDTWFGFGWNFENLGLLVVVAGVAAAVGVWRFKWD